MGEEAEHGDRARISGELTLTSTVLAIDYSNLYYRVCGVCQRTLHFISNSDDAPTLLCIFCHSDPVSASSVSKRVFRILMSVATDTEVFTVICFDRVARVLFGCSADEFFHFSKIHPFSEVTANEILRGEMFQMTLSKPINDNAQHMRVISTVPLSTAFCPVLQILRERYRQSQGS